MDGHHQPMSMDQRRRLIARREELAEQRRRRDGAPSYVELRLALRENACVTNVTHTDDIRR